MRKCFILIFVANTELDCSRRWVVTLKDAVGLEDLYKYSDSDLCTVKLWPVLEDSFADDEDPELVEPTVANLGTPIYRDVHAGYRSCLAGFIREIEFMTKGQDTSHNCLFRGTYLTKVLDHFGDELENRSDSIPPSRFRSKVLNPILQRQLRGVTDYEAGTVKYAVGITMEKVAKFYLKEDPLNQSNRIPRLHNSMYMWPVRNSYIYLNADKLPKNAFTKTMNHSTEMNRNITLEWNAGKLTALEMKIVGLERTQGVYSELIADAVSPSLALDGSGRFSS